MQVSARNRPEHFRKKQRIYPGQKIDFGLAQFPNEGPIP